MKMLDKKIPYVEIWMKRSAGLPIREKKLPEEFKITTYQLEDEKAWAEIECSVLEFEEIKDALAYFDKSFAPYPEELKKRMLFIETEDGEKVATCSAWWKEVAGKKVPNLHWLAVKPEFQGHGLATILVSEVTKLLQKYGENQPIYLHTQTWSHAAIGLYESFGYQLVKENIDGSINPNYLQAMMILERLKK